MHKIRPLICVTLFLLFLLVLAAAKLIIICTNSSDDETYIFCYFCSLLFLFKNFTIMIISTIFCADIKFPFKLWQLKLGHETKGSYIISMVVGFVRLMLVIASSKSNM